jgi:segregation and condensation protein B
VTVTSGYEGDVSEEAREPGQEGTHSFAHEPTPTEAQSSPESASTEAGSPGDRPVDSPPAADDHAPGDDQAPAGETQTPGDDRAPAGETQTPGDDQAPQDDQAPAGNDQTPAGDDQESVGEGSVGEGSVGEGSVGEESVEQGHGEPAHETLDVSVPGDLYGPIEAILLIVDEPLPAVTLAQVLGRPRPEIEEALRALSDSYTKEGRGFDLREVAGGWRLYTREEYADLVERFVLDGQQARLTQAALETLAVIAYRQPVSRSRVSAIRGVNCDGVVRTLLTRGLIEEAGADGESGATLYRTTSYFLERLGLGSLEELPSLAPYLPDVDEMDPEQASSALDEASAPNTGEPARAADPELPLSDQPDEPDQPEQSEQQPPTVQPESPQQPRTPHQPGTSQRSGPTEPTERPHQAEDD